MLKLLGTGANIFLFCFTIYLRSLSIYLSVISSVVLTVDERMMMSKRRRRRETEKEDESKKIK